jgi:hypothetical protein
MKSFSRRDLLISGVAIGSPSTSLHAQSDDTKAEMAKREFVRQMNELWKKQSEAEEARAKEEEKRGQFSSLAPPQELKPFKDWDYYYTKGRPTLWSPNPGQSAKYVKVPAGFVTDLASIPQKAWSLGLRPEGPYAYAAIVHDYLYWTHERSKEEADRIFRWALEDSKVDRVLRETMYFFVSNKGQEAWDKNEKLKAKGEKRFLKRFPSDFTTSWKEWKKQPGVFWD